MLITSITKYKGRRYKVEIDGEYWNILDVDILNQFELKPGLECDEEFLQEIIYAADYRKTRERALYLLGYRDHSSKELLDKLRKTTDNPEIIEEVLHKMEEYGFLDDERYARKLARNLLERKNLGLRRAEYDMRGKGVPQEIARMVLEEYEIDPQEQIIELLDKKYARFLEDEKGIRKTVNALIRLGHSYDDIKTALRRYEDEFEEY